MKLLLISLLCLINYIKCNDIYVVGISAGGFMAVQHHIAFSSYINGAGIIAGGPFYCAQNNINNALIACMSQPELLDTSVFVDAAKYCTTTGVCDDLNYLKNDKIWLFSGTSDTVVKQGVMKSLEEFYQSFIPISSIKTIFNIPAEHSWITNNFGNNCGTLGTPFVNNCNLNAAYDMLKYIISDNILPPGIANNTNIKKIPQNPPLGSSLGPNAYLYTSSKCTTSNCTTIIAYHGCKQTIDDIGEEFIMHAGLNEVAETNGFRVLYPQAIKSSWLPMNPQGCFDWWGYTNENYSNQNAVQLQVVKNLIDNLL